MRSGNKTPDLFTQPCAQEGPGTSDGPVRQEIEASEAAPSCEAVSILHFKKEQARLREAGVKSASAWWMARGRVWP